MLQSERETFRLAAVLSPPSTASLLATAERVSSSSRKARKRECYQTCPPPKRCGIPIKQGLARMHVHRLVGGYAPGLFLPRASALSLRSEYTDSFGSSIGAKKRFHSACSGHPPCMKSPLRPTDFTHPVYRNQGGVQPPQRTARLDANVSALFGYGGNARQVLGRSLKPTPNDSPDGTDTVHDMSGAPTLFSFAGPPTVAAARGSRLGLRRKTMLMDSCIAEKWCSIVFITLHLNQPSPSIGSCYITLHRRERP